MSDDFWGDWDDMDDIFYDPDNDYEENLMDEHADMEYSEFADEESIDQESAKNDENRLFDMAEAVIFGSMVVGNAIEESLEEKRRKQLIESEDDQTKE